MKKRNPNVGGSRPGAGRKPMPGLELKSFRLDAETRGLLERASKASGSPKAAIVRGALARLGRRKWPAQAQNPSIAKERKTAAFDLDEAARQGLDQALRVSGLGRDELVARAIRDACRAGARP